MTLRVRAAPLQEFTIRDCQAVSVRLKTFVRELVVIEPSPKSSLTKTFEAFHRFRSQHGSAEGNFHAT